MELSEKSVVELRNMAKVLGIENTTKMKKSELMDAIQNVGEPAGTTKIEKNEKELTETEETEVLENIENLEGQERYNITSDTDDTYSQGKIVVGRAKGWIEKDFSRDISGKDFMDNVAEQIGTRIAVYFNEENK